MTTVTPIIDLAQTFTSLVPQVLESIKALLPVCIPIVGTMAAIGLGLKLFRRLTAR